MSFSELIEREIDGNAIKLLDIAAPHLDELAKLPFHHKDPFDRLIIAQALAEGLPVVSRDTAFGAYHVQVAW